jgi:cytoskeletal protein CcmA (bactofilin family)
MRNGKDNQVHTIIGQGVSFEGTLISREGLRIDGNVKGRIECESTLMISTSARVQAEIICENAFIAGEVRGTVIGKKVIQISQNGKIIGDITTAGLVMEPGAVFDGKCLMNHESHDLSMLAAGASAAGDLYSSERASAA